MRTTLFYPAALAIMNLAIHTSAVSIVPYNQVQQATELSQTDAAAAVFLDTDLQTMTMGE